MFIIACLLLMVHNVILAEEAPKVEGFGRNNPLDLPENKVILPLFGRVFDLYKTEYEVRNILAPISGYNDIIINNLSSGLHPPLYFNLLDNGKNLGQFVLINKTLHKINDGRDSVADYPGENFSENYDKNVYIGASDGIYIYDVDTRDVQKYGTIDDNILAIDKASGKDEIYILTTDHKIYKVTEHGTVKTRVEGIDYAKDFVLGLLETIYFSGEDNKPRALLKGQTTPHKYEEFDFNVINAIFCRPVIDYGDINEQENSVPFIVDGVPYALIGVNQSLPMPDTARVPGLTAFSAEYGFFHFLAADGLIYMDSILGPSNDEKDYYDVKQRSKKYKSSNKIIAFDRDVKADYEAFKKLYNSKVKIN